jgi:spermidine synthase
MEKKKHLKNINPNGDHYIINFYGCDQDQINSVGFWKKILPNSIKGSQMTVLKDYFYKFSPQGVTGFLLLSSSHISIHTWPEHRYVSCDVFSCSPEKETKDAVDYLVKNIQHANVEITKIKRGFVYNHIFTSDTKYLELPIFSTGEKMELKIKEILYKEKSDFQEILIVDSKEHGKCLIIDGVMQCAESDHELYDRELLKPLKKTDKKILILGGGDGYVAQTALQKNSDLNVKIVDLDLAVVKSCRINMDQKIFDDSRVNLSVEDAFHYLKNTVDKVNGKFNGIICDLTDAPIGRRNKRDFERFYSELIKLSSDHLKTGGWISVQAGASKNTPYYIDAVGIIEKLLKKYFKNTKRSDIFIPSYGESCAFLFGRK